MLGERQGKFMKYGDIQYSSLGSNTGEGKVERKGAKG